MLSTEHPIQINGFTLFRDLNDTEDITIFQKVKSYCLKAEKSLIL